MPAARTRKLKPLKRRLAAKTRNNSLIKEKGHPTGGLSLLWNIAFCWIEQTQYQQLFRNINSKLKR
jgi:hypothetical protein